MTLFIVALSVALGVSFLCSLMEATLLSLTPSQIATLSERHPRAATIWRGFKSNIERPIAVILILNTTAHTIGASLAGAQFDELWGSEWIWVFSVAFTLVMLQFTELLPKTIGVQFNLLLAPLIARPLQASMLFFKPVISVLHFLNRPFERRKESGPARSTTLDEIASLAAMARMSKDIGMHQERVIQGATRLSEKRVRDMMIPIEQVVMLSDDLTLAKAVVAAHIDAHTRFPVHAAGDRDKVLGYVNFKELVYFMSMNPQDPSLKGVTRPITFVAADASAVDLMRLFVDQHEHIAIVRSKDGRALGLVTLEDLVEELIGDVEDEFDRLPKYSHALTGGTWLFGGGVPMSEVSRSLEGALPSGTGSLSSFIEAELGGSLRGGQVIRRDRVEILVRRVRRGRVFEASISRAGVAL